MHKYCYACEGRTSWHDNWYVNQNQSGDILHYLCGYCYQHLLSRPRRFKSKQDRNEFFRQMNKGKAPPNKGVRMQYNRQCYACGSTTTFTDKTGRRHWMINHDGNVLCNKCKMRYITNPNGRVWHTLLWKGKTIKLKYDIKTGFCSCCGKATSRTQMHHIEYDIIDPFKNTIELCESCHAIETWKSRKP